MALFRVGGLMLGGVWRDSEVISDRVFSNRSSGLSTAESAENTERISNLMAAETSAGEIWVWGRGMRRAFSPRLWWVLFPGALPAGWHEVAPLALGG